MMKYKDYIGKVEYDDEARIFHGEVIGLKDVITFQGTSVEELEEAFIDSIDDYLVWCKERNEKPEKPYSGKFNVRISPELHAQLVALAKSKKTSLNNYVTEALNETVNSKTK